MALQIPLITGTPDGVTDQSGDNIMQMNAEQIQDLHDFAAYVYSTNPSVRLEVNGSNGTLMAGQPFVDTYYIAGAYSTRVDRFATEAETANISLSTDNYSRLRLVTDSVSLPTGDSNNLQYPLYLHNDGGTIQLRTMSRQDFIDTFVTPGLGAIESGGFYNAANGSAQAGTYYLSTNSAPAGGTLVSSTPVAVNSVADVSAYTASGIPETQKQTTDTNYYLIKNTPDPTSFTAYTAEFGYGLPLYFDAGTETIRIHTATTWANLLNPFLRYYFATVNSGYWYEYNLSSGTQKGTTYTDERLSGTSTYEQRFVNANDYRTQEFPTGTASTIAANTKRLYINRGSGASYVATAPASVAEGNTLTFTLSTSNVTDGTTFAYVISGITAADISSGSLTGNITVNSNTGTASVVLSPDSLNSESETATITITTPAGDRTASTTITEAGLSDFPDAALTSWGTDSRYISGQTTGTVASARCYLEVLNNVSGGEIEIETLTEDNAAAGTPYSALMNVTGGYTSAATIEARYVATYGDISGGGYVAADAGGGSSVNGTWYTIAQGGTRNFGWQAAATTPSSGTAIAERAASAVYFEIRISETGLPTATKTSVTKTIQLDAQAIGAAAEILSLEGTSGSPEASNSLPTSDGDITAGWRFSTDGTIEDYFTDRVPNYSSTGHINWINVSSPSKTYYIRATVADNAATGYTAGGDAVNTWHALTSNRSFTARDQRNVITYGPAHVTWKIDLSESATGADQTVSNNYSTTSGSEYYWREEQVDAFNYRITVYYNGDEIWNQDGYTSSNIPSSVTASNGYVYSPGTSQGNGDNAVTRTIPGILETGYYKAQWEGTG